MPLWRAVRSNVYHTCSRCGTRRPLAQMKWQNGILVCQFSGCVDTAILGSRDINVARAVGVYRHEMEPDPKITSTVDRKNDQNDVLF